MFSLSGLFKGFLGLSVLAHRAISAPVVEKRGPTCHDLTIPVAITGSNYVIPPTFILDPATVVTQILSLILRFVVPNTTYNLRATYCEPEVNVPSRANTLQLLVHTYSIMNRNYCKHPQLLPLEIY